VVRAPTRLISASVLVGWLLRIGRGRNAALGASTAN
jgi:hypothetical protein